jgi:hypothetical protein
MRVVQGKSPLVLVAALLLYDSVVSVVHHLFEKTTAEAQSTQRLHREEVE